MLVINSFANMTVFSQINNEKHIAFFPIVLTFFIDISDIYPFRNTAGLWVVSTRILHQL